MTTKVLPVVPDPDPDFPHLPRFPDKERRGWGEEQRWKRHLRELEENARRFDRRRRELVREGMSEIEAGIAATKPPLPTPSMNKVKD
jgi:hypothetical protein